MKISGTALCVSLFIAIPGILFAQSKKDIRKTKIKSIKESTPVLDGKEVNRSVRYEKYDPDVNLLEIIDYDKEGKVKMHESYTYNKNGDKTEELEYGTDGKLKRKKVMKYNAMGDKTEEDRFDPDGTFIEKELYTYDANGNCTTELTFDSKNILTQKSYNLYDKKGNRIEKRTVDPQGKVMEVRKFELEYY